MSEALNNNDLPDIPSKRYFTIGETSELCDVKSHVLRYWEQEFPMLKPMKRRGNRRYYQRSDVLLIREIRRLLYDHGYTISGACQKLSNHKDNQKNNHNRKNQLLIRQLIIELEEIHSLLKP
jgi:DNA-binding transcriptional MerR regulator